MHGACTHRPVYDHDKVLTLTEMLLFLAEFSLLESSLLQLLLAAHHDLFVPVN